MHLLVIFLFFITLTFKFFVLICCFFRAITVGIRGKTMFASTNIFLHYAVCFA